MPDLDKKINELIADIRNQSENENKNTACVFAFSAFSFSSDVFSA